MKRSLLAPLTGLLFALSACGGGGGSDVLFSDNFDDPAEAGSWPGGSVLPNGWVSAYPTEQRWYVATSGGDGGADDHALVADNGYADILLHAISAKNYTVSANINYRPGLAAYPYPTYSSTQQAWILGRAQLTSYFACRLAYEEMGAMTNLYLLKWTEGGLSTEFGQVWFPGPLELGVYYRLSMTLDGDTVTCRASSASHAEVSVTMDDDGSTYGPKLTGTSAGLRFNGEVSFHPCFDDFLVEKL